MSSGFDDIIPAVNETNNDTVSPPNAYNNFSGEEYETINTGEFIPNVYHYYLNNEEISEEDLFDRMTEIVFDTSIRLNLEPLCKQFEGSTSFYVYLQQNNEEYTIEKVVPIQ